MCRLLGLVANRTVDLEYSLRKFKELAHRNADGWGIGWYQNDFSKVYKQGISALQRGSRYVAMTNRVKSKIFISHVRNKGKGAPAARENSHPFWHENWIFAHNGSVDREWLLSSLKDVYRKAIQGGTDSEAYFYHVLQNIERSQGDVVDGVGQAVALVVKREHKGLNFLLSDGHGLYAFRYSDSPCDGYSLFQIRRDSGKPGLLEFRSQETEQIIRSKSLSGEKAVLVCSEKLTEESWEEVGWGQMLIIAADLSVKRVQILP